MEFRKLGNLDVSTIGWEPCELSMSLAKREIAVRSQIVDNCLGNDINLIDTAAWYGNAEQVLGEITKGRRHQFYLATKYASKARKPARRR